MRAVKDAVLLACAALSLTLLACGSDAPGPETGGVDSTPDASADEGLPSQDEGPQPTDEGPDTSDEGPDASDEGPDASDEGPDASDDGPDASDEGPDASDEGPDASDEGPDASDEGPDASDEGPDASDEGPDASDATDEGPDTSDQGPDASDEGPDASDASDEGPELTDLPGPDEGPDAMDVPGPDEGPDASEVSDADVVDPCDCGDLVCGTGPCGDLCGVCGPGEVCTPGGQCAPDGGGLGQACGYTPDCPYYVPSPGNPSQLILNPDAPDCLHDQCDLSLCLIGGASGLYLPMPVCSRACSIVKDEVNNLTGAPGADGIEDLDTPVSDCEGFVDGPAGATYICAASAGFASYCVPSVSGAVNPCTSDADCAEGERCRASTVGGPMDARCFAELQSGPWGDAVDVGQQCNELDPFAPEGLQYCDGFCYGIGCVTFCADDADCDTTVADPDQGCEGGTCLGWPGKSCVVDSDCSAFDCKSEGQQVFTSLPDFTPSLCWPKGCDTDADCPSDAYCRMFWNGEPYPDAGWDNLCLAKTEGGAQLGEACDEDPSDDVPGAICASEDLCVGGYCSALCATDDECGVDQLCAVVEFPGDYDGDGVDDFSLSQQWCQSFVGATTSCVKEADCAEWERCEPYQLPSMIEDPANPGEMIPDPDGPFVLAGLCVSSDEALGGYGDPCNDADDCHGGFCVGASPFAPGFCSQMCGAAADCPMALVTDSEGNPISVTSRCSTLLYGWGDDIAAITPNVWLPLCQPNPADSSGEDCSADFTCAEADEACLPYIVMWGGPANEVPAHLDYLCLDINNADGTLPGLATGETCDPDAQDAFGNPLTQCVSALCIEGAEAGSGYCSELCDPAGAPCPGGLSCLELVVYPRSGAYVDSSGGFFICQQDTDCTPCLTSVQCPGDRVCANLGPDEGALADYRCVPGCTSSADCAGAAATTCSGGSDSEGQPVMGCFDTNGGLPVNYCE